QVDPKVANILSSYCTECHEDGTEKGKFRLDTLEKLPLDSLLDVMNRMHEKVHFEEMPPKKKDQPSEEERRQLENWLAGVLNANNASKLEEKLRMPEYGNKVDHEKLFSGKYKDLPGYTSDRRWLISEFIFDAKFNKLLDHNGRRNIDGKGQSVIGDNARSGVNLTNPFLLPTHSGVRYYDTTVLDGGHLLTMLTNAKEAATFMIGMARRKNLNPAITKIMAMEWEHEKILAARESYLVASIEELLPALYKEKHEAMLPKFDAAKYVPPPEAKGPDGKPLKKPVFDTAKPSNDELDQMWAAIQRNSQNGEKDAALITKCERDWFIFGVNERTIQTRLIFMHGYLDELIRRMPTQYKPRPKAKPPVEVEMNLIRAAVLKHRMAGDRYNQVIAKCLAEWKEEFKQARIKAGGLSDAMINELVDQLFNAIIERSPTSQEKAEYVAMVKSYFQNLGNEEAIQMFIQTLILRTDFVYRNEFGEGTADAHGRRMLSPRDASYALAYALTDSSPDKELAAAASGGRLITREDYRREVERMLKNRSQYYVVDEAVERIGLNDSFTNIPIRKLRFFREFFGYPAMISIFKDNKRFGGNYTDASARLVSEADMLVEHIIEQDRNVFERLLTTEEFYVYHSGNNQEMAASVEHIRKIYEYFKDKDWKNFDAAMLKTHAAFLTENPLRGVPVQGLGEKLGRQDTLKTFKITLANYSERLNKGQTAAMPFPVLPSHEITEARTRTGRQMRGPEVAKSFNLDMANWNYPAVQPAKMQNRKGILTHPAWLIAFAANTETDPIRRGKWVREKLLAGTVPDVPITVDAVIPEDHHNTLRTRLDKKTKAEYCWGCHERMNPVGLSFETYDDFGRYRVEEFLEHPDNLIKKMPEKGMPQEDLRDIYKTLPVDSKGYLAGTGDPALDGDIKDAIDLTERLAKSAKVRQSIIRHAFRYFMGRNEFLSDSKTLMDADQAYVKSGGSFDAVIVSLLTSDSFIYRKPITK
ncbi:MAG: hypothetical protein CFE26_10730, partial [Verrucomicrobiales bacterium VVV1]